MYYKVQAFFFGLFYITMLFITLSTIKQIQSITHKTGVKQSAEIITKPMR